MYHFNQGTGNQAQPSSSESPQSGSNGNAFSAFGISHSNQNNIITTENSGSGSAAAIVNRNTINDSSSEETPHDRTALPITLSLTGNNNNNNNNPNLNSVNAATNHILNVPRSTLGAAAAAADLALSNNNNTGNDPNGNTKNVRHYVYSANQPNADSLLHLDLQENTILPPKLTNKELRKLKDKNGLFSLRLTPFIDNVSTTNQGLYFDPIVRTAGPGSQLVIGRYTERVREAISKLPENYHPVVFKSKVISRTHGCFKVDSQGNWYIKDVKSSSGTFLNHQRLSPASTLSKDIPLHDGDVLQLGMDFRGGTEEIYRCVKMRVEINKSWKRKANAFNKEALNKIKELQKLTNGGIDEEDCSICLSKIKPCQAIFISPCSHSWHFHCVRRLVMSSYPQFVCPNCRAACDLEATIESSDSEDALSESDDEVQEDHQIQQSQLKQETDLVNKNNSGVSEVNTENENANHTGQFNIFYTSPHNNNNINENNHTTTSQLDPNVLNSLGVQLDDPKDDIDMEH
ncbi:hypothetical protein C6P45_000986 [Maudiozyma exigua]|uniref:RING-type E3 ubiquitin transferase n=1 Tax=Maudiozyma exigua TaxID=34358 RepID=A0A9P7BB32_MAUEX|nr:hypothetical protein C6P45_000986 [Kazachstania exigua]